VAIVNCQEQRCNIPTVLGSWLLSGNKTGEVTKAIKKVKLLNVWGFLEPNPCADSGNGVCIKLRKNASTHAPKQLGNQTQQTEDKRRAVKIKQKIAGIRHTLQ